MAEGEWELQDVKLRRGETPEVLARHMVPEVAVGSIRDAIETRLESHLESGAPVDCVRVVNDHGEVVEVVTATDLQKEAEEENGPDEPAKRSGS